VPHRYDDRGWYDYRPINPSYLIDLWYLSQEQQDYERILEMADAAPWSRLAYRKGKGDFGHEGPWLRFLQGLNPDYPYEILRANYQETLRRLEKIRADQSNPPDRNVHHWQERNPVVLEGLVQTMCGGPNHIYQGGLLQVRLRYFDPARKRPGVPPDVAALVDGLTPHGLSLHLVNLHPTEPREVVLQAGAFGEHQFTEVNTAQNSRAVNSKFLTVHLKPGAAGHLQIGMKRFANQPTYATPWQ
jgi:hypothetical protein